MRIFRIPRFSFIYQLVAISTLAMPLVSAQLEQPNAKDHTKAYLQEVNKFYYSYRGAIKNERFSGTWVDGKVMQRIEKNGRIDFIMVDPETGESKPAFDHDKLAAEIKRVSGKNVNAKKLPIREFDNFGRDLKLKCFNKWYLLLDETLQPYDKSISCHDLTISPDGKWQVKYVKFNAVLVNRQDKSEKKITTDGNAKRFYSGVEWSPDSKKWAFYRGEAGQRRIVTMIEASPKGQVQPKIYKHRYDKPGDKIDQYFPMIAYTDGSETMTVESDILKNHFKVSNLKWRSEDELTFHGVERGFGKYHVVLVSTKNKTSKVIISEESDTYVNWQNLNWNYTDNDSSNREIIWLSERDGYGHLYLYDAVTGEVKNQITKGEYVVKKILYVDEVKRRILFTAGGDVKGLDPYYLQYYWVNFDGSGMARITDPKLNHKLKFSADYRFALDIASAPDQAPSYDLINAETGKLIKNLGKCDISKLRKTSWQQVEPFVAKDRDGKFEVWGNIYRPPNFDPNKKYPVIEYIYAGPHGHFVSKDFRFWNTTIDEVAAQGFIVVQIDGKGTNGRCREFSHFAYKNLIDSGFPDRIAWMKAAAAKYPQMDLTRVGIYGGSAGGQSSTAALLTHSDFYKVAVSDCGCHDNRMDKIWWNEQWMDYPVGPHYAEQSNVTLAHKLKGALMLTVGELDRNVDPASTMQLAHALTRANKKFDLYVVPSADHGAGEQTHLRSLRARFFKEYLGDPNSR